MNLREHLQTVQRIQGVDLDLLGIQELQRIHTETERLYEIPGGEHRWPSVTTMIGAVSDRELLDHWIKAVGKEYAEEVRDEAGFRGTEVHDALERYLLGDKISQGQFTSSFYWWFFRQIVPYVDRHVSKVYATEVMVYNRDERYAGTLDLCADYREEITVLDFKNHDKLKTRDMVWSAVIQCVLYAIALEKTAREQLGIEFKPTQVAVLVANAGGSSREIVEPITPSLVDEALSYPREYWRRKDGSEQGV